MARHWDPCQYEVYDGQFEDWKNKKSSCYERGRK